MKTLSPQIRAKMAADWPSVGEWIRTHDTARLAAYLTEADMERLHSPCCICHYGCDGTPHERPGRIGLEDHHWLCVEHARMANPWLAPAPA